MLKGKLLSIFPLYLKKIFSYILLRHRLRTVVFTMQMSR